MPMKRQHGLLEIWMIEAIAGVVALTIGGVIIHSYWESHVIEPARIEGDARTTKKLQPKIDKLISDLAQTVKERDQALDANQKLSAVIDNLKLQLKASNDAVDRLSKLADQARATTKRLMADIAARAKSDAMLPKLEAIAAGPATAVNEVCAKADEYLTQLANWRHGTT